MEDIELIEKYFLNVLSDDELTAFNERLKNDTVFKKQFEIESVIVKSLQYAQEKQRIQAIHAVTMEMAPTEPSKFANNSLVFIIGAAFAVWLFVTMFLTIIKADPENLKWLGMLVAMLLSFITTVYRDRRVIPRFIPISGVNGLLIFLLASGIDAINQGVNVKANQAEAALIPFTENASWWPTRSLMDSLSEKRKTIGELEQELGRVKQEFSIMKDSCFEVTFDRFTPIIVPKSTVVAAGGKYEAEIFLAASNSKQKMEFFVNGIQVSGIGQPNTKIGSGKIEFTATGGTYDPQTLLATKKYVAEIKLPDTTLREEVEYYVAEPVIKVTTGNAPTLYMNCGNTVNIEVPALGTNYKPSFSAQGASIIKGDKPGRVTIIPSQRKINVAVSNAGAGLGSVAFDVKPIPLPRYVIRDNSGKEVDKKVGVRGGSLTGLRVVPEPDPTFKEEVPQDAVYRIGSMEVIHARGSSPVNRMNVTNEVLDLEPWRSQFKPGDRIVIEIKAVTRRTYQGKEERVEVRNEVLTVPIQ